jgi:hypothetical protein
MIPSGKISVVLFLFFLLPQLTVAQQFNYAAELNKVDTSGFYEIFITPEISRYLKPDFSDIRIAGENNRWVPHILEQGEAIVLENLFTAFPILQNRVNDSGKNLLIVENTKTGGINNLKLLLKNAAVSRVALLSGSNNQQDWYIIDDNININRSYETTKDEYMQEINFPLAKYRYLKLVIDNAHNEPLRVSRVGFYGQPAYKKPIAYHVNPAPQFIQKDSNHYSYITVKQADSYQFEEISISTNGPRYYSRDVQICLPDFDKNNISMPGRVIGNFKLISGTTCLFYLTRTKAPLFYILIKNGDSPPLKIDTIRTALKNIALVSYLEKDKKYKLLLGDSLASFADYDLQTFKDSITVKRVLKYGDVYPISKKTLNKKDQDKNWWIWPAIILAGLALSFLTYRLTGDINKPAK